MDDSERQVRVLAVSARESETFALANILGHSAWSLLIAKDIASANEILGQHQVHVLLSDLEMTDGTWKDLLEDITKLPEPPQLIVTAFEADNRLWAEVLNLGAWDILLKPFQTKDVFRTIHLAWQQWTNHRRLPRRAAGSSTASEPAIAVGSY